MKFITWFSNFQISEIDLNDSVVFVQQYIELDSPDRQDVKPILGLVPTVPIPNPMHAPVVKAEIFEDDGTQQGNIRDNVKPIIEPQNSNLLMPMPPPIKEEQEDSSVIPSSIDQSKWNKLHNLTSCILS